MAQIGLRVYDREIESLIDRGQIDEAIAHSKYILKDFPKHIETYRLLGKCYLESQRYIEAADILQRVLTVFPDDFISHIGMSIICEDENNLEKAIWHMERALEVQPSNSAVNSELRRLMTLRDGSEPSKVHLSQGAYIRMCVKSGLHEQAIAEAKSALSKEPQRVDLELILAKMYAELDQKPAAIDQLTIILHKLPYCYEANLLMTQVLSSLNRTSEIPTYKERLVSVDPYYAFITAESPTPDLVPDDAVSVEKIEWQYSDDDTQRHTKILGVDWQDAKGPLASSGVTTKSFNQDSLPTEIPEESMIPTFESMNVVGAAAGIAAVDAGEAEQEKTQEIKELQQDPEISQPIPVAGMESETVKPTQVMEDANPGQSEPSPVEKEIPDWMKAAGWTESSGETMEPEAVVSEVSSPVEAAQSAEIPDWIKTMAPQEVSQPEAQSEEEAERIELLNKILPEVEPPQTPSISAAEAAQSISESFISTPIPASSENNEPGISFESLGLGSASAEQPSIQIEQQLESSSDSEMPDWMQLAKDEVPHSQPTPTIEEESPSLPVWMAVSDQLDEEKLEFPDQKSLASQAEEPPQTIEPGPVELPDWLRSGQPDGSEESKDPVGQTAPLYEGSPDIFATAPENRESFPTWSPSGDQELNAPSFAQEEEIPEWLREEEPPAAISQSASDVTIISSSLPATENIEEPAAAQPGDADLAEIPDWLKEVNTDQSPVLSIPDEDILPEWAKPPSSTELEPVSSPESALESFMESVEIPSTVDQEFGEPQSDISLPVVPLPIESESPATPPSNSPGLDSLLDQLSQGNYGSSAEATPLTSEAYKTPEAASVSMVGESEEANYSQEEPPFVDTTAEIPEEAREDVTLVSKPFIEFEKVEPAADSAADVEEKVSTDDQPTPLETPFEEGEPVVVPAIDSDLGELPPVSSQLPPEIFEAPVLDQTIPDDTLDVTADIDIESWLNSLEEVNPPSTVIAPASEQVPVSIFKEQPSITALPVEVDEVVLDRIPTDTAPLASIEEDPVRQAQSPLDELEEAASFQSISPLATAMNQIGLQPEEPPTFEDIPAEAEAKTPTEPLILPVEEVKLPQTYEEWLDYANSSISDGNLETAVDVFSKLIKKGSNIEETVQSLRSAVYRFPSEVSIWQTLGDGYARSNRLQEALDAYTKAEELLS